MRTFAQATRVLGTLEERVMEIIWSAEPLTVRQVCRRLRGRRPPLAYTTVMTTLDRLHKKGLLTRTKQGNAFVYRPGMTRDEYHRRVLQMAVQPLMASSGLPVLAAFVDLAAAVDQANLARLEALIAERRRSGK